jgi:hypothetical protein
VAACPGAVAQSVTAPSQRFLLFLRGLGRKAGRGGSPHARLRMARLLSYPVWTHAQHGPLCHRLELHIVVGMVLMRILRLCRLRLGAAVCPRLQWGALVCRPVGWAHGRRRVYHQAIKKVRMQAYECGVRRSDAAAAPGAQRTP